MAIHIKVPGAAGELVQGSLDGEPFLVTCPIRQYNYVYVTDKQDTVLPAKAQAALQKTLHYLQLAEFPYGLRLVEQLPKGKGMASSSADIAAVCQAVALACGRVPLSETVIAKIAASIEPTDGVFCQGIVCINHLTGEIKQRWQPQFSWYFLLFDLGGSVDTLKFNSRQDLAELNKAKEPQISEAFQLLEDGFKNADISKIAAAATISAFANQVILPKPNLSLMHEIAVNNGALGINIAHSGTIVGMIFPQENLDRNIKYCRTAMQKFCPNATLLDCVGSESGGIFKAGELT